MTPEQAREAAVRKQQFIDRCITELRNAITHYISCPYKSTPLGMLDMIQNHTDAAIHAEELANAAATQETPDIA